MRVMETLLTEIERALTMRLYYLAILLTLQLPDICGALESTDGEAKSDRYKAWCRLWFLPKYLKITEHDIYCLRCGVIHQGKFGHPRLPYVRVLFTLPNAREIVLHNGILNDALNLHAPIFCQDMIDSVRSWCVAKQNDTTVQDNLLRLVQYRPDGLNPHIEGVPVIG
jgi:hypothetical protein